MTAFETFLATARDLLLGAAWARGSWCRRQRLLLRRPDHGVLWVGRDVVPWAEWGAARGYFDLQRMAGLPYLTSAAAPLEA
ncbi:MAG TPA: hypothetical protein VFP50_10730 [Anaeromyxobacteraceae bacterium]|nr:hypothetical protein [Anaeromyxobacteraceae bacterium]